MSRKLATIDVVRNIEVHPEADRLDIAIVRGWQCVVPKGQFQIGEPVIFIEPDAFLYEDEPRFSFLMSRGVRTAPDGKSGHVLKTTKLRGILSQGLVLKVDEWKGSVDLPPVPGTDITDRMPLRLWETQIPLQAEVIGKFPPGIPKTDEERIQNIGEDRVSALYDADYVVVTEKVDGMSVSIWMDEGRGMHVAGRNWELSPDSGIFRAVEQTPVFRFVQENGDPFLYVQGELIGPHIQGNPLRLPKIQYRVFNVGERHGDRLAMGDWSDFFLEQSVPILPYGQETLNRGDWLLFANRRSTITPDVMAEGVVIRSYVRRVMIDSFKAINNEYLLKKEKKA